jgi:formylglycine-generating enzyme
VAERPLDPAAFPGAPPENLVPGSLVFTRTAGPVDLRHMSQWWTWTPGACWRFPEGPRSSIAGRERHPVVHVAYEDASAYAGWAGKELPTEAQWELAARGGLDGATYVWGDEPERASAPLANYWHGDFPWRAQPGYGTTQPVGSYPPNGHDLYDMAGNVWEWTADWYSARHPDDAGNRAAYRATRAAPACGTAWTRSSRSTRSRARSSRAARSSAPTTTACATGPPRDGRR